MSNQRRKRRRRRGGAGPQPAGAGARRRARPPERAPAKAAGSRRAPRAERPPAPWGSFPLGELIILLALVMLVASFVVSGTRAGPLFLVALALGSLATIEFAVREHFAGYRSHSVLLAAVPAVIALGLLFYLAPPGLGIPVRIAIGAAVFGLALWGLVTTFRRRAGVSFKLRG